MRKKILFCIFGFVLMAFLPLAGLGAELRNDVEEQSATTA